MEELKKKSIDMLCKLGKYGVGKSLMLGMYEFDLPIKLRSEQLSEDKEKK